MIKLNKGPKPAVLVANQTTWSSDLQALITQYGSYKDIPKKEKTSAINHYKNDEILNALKQDPGGKKCVYCETLLEVSSFSNIEHYHPKSLYPLEIFEWGNMFMGCTMCNSNKNNFDTVNKPFIHPLNEDPERYLTFDELRLVPRESDPNKLDYQKAYNVIEACKLKYRNALIRKHADLLHSFLNYIEKLEEELIHYNSLTQNAAKRKSAINILESLNILKSEASVDSEYAGYTRYLLRKFDEIRQSVAIVNLYPNDLVPDTGFDWGFVY